MPSPFSGMAPSLEDPAVWPDFHSAFAGDLRASLNTLLPHPHDTRLESRPEIGHAETLPWIDVPLHENKDKDEVLLDLQYVFDRTYDTGPYRGAVARAALLRAFLTAEEPARVRERAAAIFPPSLEDRS